MSCLGVHFALDQGTVDKLKSISSEIERLGYIQEELEEDFFTNHPDSMAQTDKAWDTIHRTLTDGLLEWDNGEYPLKHVILAGELLYTDTDYIISLKTPQQVKDIAAALPGVSDSQFKTRYFELDPDEYECPVTDEDFEYTLEWFVPLREFYARAAKDGRYVLFTADQ